MARIGFASLGCAKNLVDTEVMLGMLQEAGHQIVEDEAEAEVILVNTCGFIKDAQRESIRTIMELGQTEKKLVVTGCLVQGAREDLVTGLPEASAFVGTAQWPAINEVVDKVLQGERIVRLEPSDFVYQGDVARVRTNYAPFAYLKISEGCDNRCKFCIIPQLRGDLASRQIPHIVAEARQMVQDGVQEIIVVSQDTTAYGQDLGKRQLPELLRALGEVDAKFRLLYCYPTLVNDQVLAAMRDTPNIMHYFDMPVQHAHPDVLKAMGRPFSLDYKKKFAQIREALPDVVLRTTFIVGYPGETEEQFQYLCDFVEELQFDHVGVFTYSNEPTCDAYKLEGQLPEREKKSRRKRLLEVQQRVKAKTMNRHIGRELDLLVEGAIPSKGEVFGRTYLDAPEVDGVTYANGHAEPGDWVKVKITKADIYDTYGEVVG